MALLETSQVLRLAVYNEVEYLGEIMFCCGRRGSVILKHAGFTYRQRKTRKSRTYWSCVIKDCKGSAVLKDSFFWTCTEHMHLPLDSDYAYQRQDFKARAKELALTRSDKPADIVGLLVEELEDTEAKDFVLQNKTYYSAFVSSLRAKRISLQELENP